MLMSTTRLAPHSGGPPRAANLGPVCAMLVVALALSACGDTPRDPQTDAGDPNADAVADTPPAAENCFNGQDDNDDLLVDCADPQCRRLDACQVYQCPDGALGDAVGFNVFGASTLEAGDDLAGSCGGNGGADLALLWTAPETGEYFIDTRWGSYDTILYVREAGCDGPELLCNDDAVSPNALQSEVTLAAEQGATYLIVVDGYDVVVGPDGDDFVLNITPASMDSERGFCGDRRDNDDDGVYDCADEECADDPNCSPLEPVVSAAAADNHTCAINADHTWCWGNNQFGQLGDGSFRSSRRPVQVRDEDGQPLQLDKIATAMNASCGIDNDGAVWCWGADTNNRLLNGDEAGHAATPITIALDAPAVDLAMGANHSCVALNDGQVYCWGANYAGQFGDGTRDTPPADATSPVRMPSVTDVVEVACGYQSTCARTATGDVWCAGTNHSNEFGDIPGSASAQQLSLSGVDQLIAGYYNTCVLQSGRVSCVGPNWSGQIGDGTRNEATTFTPAALEADVIALGCSTYSCCALTTDRAAYCWGDNNWSQLNVETVGRVMTPERNRQQPIASFTLGQQHACYIDTDGAIQCVGNNQSGQLGDGRATQATAPIRVLGPTGER